MPPPHGGHNLGECLLTTGYACSICWASIRAARQETDARDAATPVGGVAQDDTADSPKHGTTRRAGLG